MPFENEYVPAELFGNDHLGTLLYVDSVMVDNGGFQVGSDPRMKSNRRNFRVMAQQCPRPKRTSREGSFSVVMSPEHATRLRDGTVVRDHDDWACLQDMAALGYFTVPVDEIEPGVVLHFSDLGRAVANDLRAHKAAGGSISDFVIAAQAGSPTPASPANA
jgi:hypothetical protein